MQVADIISWSLGRFACFHKREVALCICVCLCVRVCEREREREEKKKGFKWTQQKVGLQLVVSDK